MIPRFLPPLRSYSDPSLWLRLEPLIRAHWEAEAGNTLQGKWATLDEVRERIGYLRGIEWVLKAAADLTRIEDPDPDE